MMSSFAKSLKYWVRIFLLLVFVIPVLGTNAQNYGNEWIVAGRTYYKFKILSSGFYQISGATLRNAGMNVSDYHQLQLWRNGVQIPLKIQLSDGVWNDGSFVQFYGERLDGSLDAALYKNPTYQTNKYYSLFADSATYFITLNPDVNGNLQFQKIENLPANAAGAAAEKYLMDTVQIQNPRDMINPGRATANYGDYVYSSSFDQGEGFTSGFVWSGSSFEFSTPACSIVQGQDAPNPTVMAGVAGCSNLGSARKVQINFSGQILENRSVSLFNNSIFELPVSADKLTYSNTGSIQVISNSTQDRIAVSFIRIAYPIACTYTNVAEKVFEISSSAIGNVIALSGYSMSNAAPVLYDITNGTYYEGVVSGNSLMYYLLPSSKRRKFIISSGAQYQSISSLNKRNFTDYTSTQNQGNYLLITNKILMAGSNPVEQFRAYRSSATGGGYDAKIYDIEDLEDQFGYGIHTSPWSIKNFLRYARATFSTFPSYVFIIGRGLNYVEYFSNKNATYTSQLDLVPTYGYPASDILLTTDNLEPVIKTFVGRLPAITPDEVSIYLEKVKEYDAHRSEMNFSIADKQWMRNFLTVSGASTTSEESSFTYYLSRSENIVKNPSLGMSISRFDKTTSGSLATITDERFNQLFDNGFSVLYYFGHASSEGLNYNLNDPSLYNNNGKYPIFFISGCDVAGYYNYDTRRVGALNTIPDKYTFTQSKGTVVFISQSSLGVPSYLNQYNEAFWTAASDLNYLKPLSNNMYNGAQAMISNPRGDSIAAYAHAEQCLFLGDPAIKLYSYEKPDFNIELSKVTTIPSQISVADDNFQLKAVIQNLGKATADHVPLRISQQHADGTQSLLLDTVLSPIYYADSVSINVPIIATRDKGENILTIQIDSANVVDEMSEINNKVSKSVFIYENGLTPIFPYNYSIVRDKNVKLVASTANPLAAKSNYRLQIDSTKLFNSNLLITKDVTISGGILEETVPVDMKDSTVYYWRVGSVDSSGNVEDWNYSSFLYVVSGGEKGFNQSGLYQKLESSFEQLSIDSSSRKWTFATAPNLFQVNHGVIELSSTYYSSFRILINDIEAEKMVCNRGVIDFDVIDPNSLKLYFNQDVPSTTSVGSMPTSGFMGSKAPCSYSSFSVRHSFEFDITTVEGRQKAAAFMQWIPDSAIVIVRNFYLHDSNEPLADTWMTDPSTSQNPNLYQSLINVGFQGIEDYTYPRSWVHIYKKSSSTYTPYSKMSEGLYDNLIVTTVINSNDSIGYVTSPAIGPSKKWYSMQWNGRSLDETTGDQVKGQLFGINNASQEVLLRNFPAEYKSMDLSNIDASVYPYLRVKYRLSDSIHYTPYQLDYWRFIYDPVPEGALAANLYIDSATTIEQGAPFNFGIAFKNVSDIDYTDSLNVQYTLTDKNNVAYQYTVPKIKPLTAGDTAIVRIHIPQNASGDSIPKGTTDLSGKNNQYLFVNPTPGQSEMTRVNNFLYQDWTVESAESNMSLDVTFDGIHILNNDIVAAKPNIQILLEDASKYLLLTDTSLVTVQVKYPDQAVRNFYFNSDSLTFIPATSADNKAQINFTPYFLEDGTYTLIVSAKNNLNGDNSYSKSYSVPFQVINKPMISDVFNYPNPFTTSTAFVFTITGSHVPQNIRIQILTITGKVVKEITKDMLGDLHVGRNITSYKWDGTDNYGQDLGNGVYLYRVITNDNGNKLDRYKVTDEDGNTINTSKYFNKGYGKMYLMR